MQETVYVRTVGVDNRNFMRVAEDIREWLIDSTVYVQQSPARIIVIHQGGSVCTVINEGDVISLTKRGSGSTHKIVNHTEKRDAVKVKIGSLDFIIETFVAEVVGTTENMKFRLTCLTDINLSGEFDDYESVKERLNEFLWEAVESGLMI